MQKYIKYKVLKISLRMVADKALLGCFISFVNITANAAFPFSHSIYLFLICQLFRKVKGSKGSATALRNLSLCLLFLYSTKYGIVFP